MTDDVTVPRVTFVTSPSQTGQTSTVRLSATAAPPYGLSQSCTAATAARWLAAGDYAVGRLLRRFSNTVNDVIRQTFRLGFPEVRHARNTVDKSTDGFHNDLAPTTFVPKRRPDGQLGAITWTSAMNSASVKYYDISSNHTVTAHTSPPCRL